MDHHHQDAQTPLRLVDSRNNIVDPTQWVSAFIFASAFGSVRSVAVAVNPSNTWFCMGFADGTIKIWDLASWEEKLTLMAHIGQVRGLAFGSKHPFLFSVGDDNLVKLWDLEKNEVIRSYQGHYSGVYSLALHPTSDFLLTGGGDSVCRMWDIRSAAQIHALYGHEDTVSSVFTRPTDPQVITGSHDSTIKLWDLRNCEARETLTHHKKSVRAMAPHHTDDCFVSASADNIKKFKLPKGEFMHNMPSRQETIINSAAVNEEGVLATAGDDGSLWFWDWTSGHNFQQGMAGHNFQQGSFERGACIHSITYDISCLRLFACWDQWIQMWTEDKMASP